MIYLGFIDNKDGTYTHPALGIVVQQVPDGYIILPNYETIYPYETLCKKIEEAYKCLI